MSSKAIDHTPDHELLLRTHRGDDRAARELWSRFGPPLVAYASAVLRGRGPAAGEDIVQSAFCRILERPPAELREVRDVRAWLATVVHRAALNERRAGLRERERLARLEATVEASHAAVREDDVMARLGALEDDLAETVLLRHAAGLTFDQMAEVLGVSRGTLSSRYQRALERLREPVAAAARARELGRAGAS